MQQGLGVAVVMAGDRKRAADAALPALAEVAWTGLTSVERLGEAWTEQSALAAQVGEAQVGVAEVGVGYP